MTEPVRLAKRLAEMLACSRREAEQYIAGGFVRVDGVVVEEPQHRVQDQKIEISPDATLLVIDLNEDFIDYLRRNIRDSRFIAVHGSAADVNEIIGQFGFAHADYILSGLPFSTLPNNLGAVIAAETAKALRPGGAFLVYQFRARARDFMAPHFRKIDSGYELWNILPCHLFWSWKE